MLPVHSIMLKREQWDAGNTALTLLVVSQEGHPALKTSGSNLREKLSLT